MIGAFPGAEVTKTRPALVLSTEPYHRYRPDVILGLITTAYPDPPSPTDCELKDWRAAGLHAPSCFRLYLVTLRQRDVRVIGRVTNADWNRVRGCIEIGLMGADQGL
ncbi:MAG: type II toxin-antitoxin system PemK/MazF family toxin [Acidobacteria bacterium]|nr:type II toxin-antitoxin system PemK/MazF family toxin [Acidobacteriota bacterium]